VGILLIIILPIISLADEDYECPVCEVDINILGITKYIDTFPIESKETCCTSVPGCTLEMCEVGSEIECLPLDCKANCCPYSNDPTCQIIEEKNCFNSCSLEQGKIERLTCTGTATDCSDPQSTEGLEESFRVAACIPPCTFTPGGMENGEIIDMEIFLSAEGDLCEINDCVPNCEGKQCGLNGCGGSCGICPKGENYPFDLIGSLSCNLDFQCVNPEENCADNADNDNDGNTDCDDSADCNGKTCDDQGNICIGGHCPSDYDVVEYLASLEKPKETDSGEGSCSDEIDNEGPECVFDPQKELCEDGKCLNEPCPNGDSDCPSFGWCKYSELPDSEFLCHQNGIEYSNCDYEGSDENKQYFTCGEEVFETDLDCSSLYHEDLQESCPCGQVYDYSSVDSVCKLKSFCPEPGKCLGYDCNSDVDCPLFSSCQPRIDCDDPDCVGFEGCEAQEWPWLCDDGIDNDADGNTDCADSNCEYSTCGEGCSCQDSKKKETNCHDGIDNDGAECVGGLFPGASCSLEQPFCVGGGDCKSLVDCEDPDCEQFFPESNCADGIDNDNDDKTDCADIDCTGKQGPNGITCCYDPDNGLNGYGEGNILSSSVFVKSKMNSVISDFCNPDLGSSVEYYCSVDGITKKISISTCQNGCYEGACVCSSDVDCPSGHSCETLGYEYELETNTQGYTQYFDSLEIWDVAVTSMGGVWMVASYVNGDYEGNGLIKLNSIGQILEIYESDEFMFSIAINSQNQIFVTYTDQDEENVELFNYMGESIERFSAGETISDGAKIAVDNNDNLIILGLISDEVLRLDPNTGVTETIIQLTNPEYNNIAVDKDNNVWLATEEGNVKLIDTNGQLVYAFTFGVGTIINSIASDGEDNLWISFGSTNKISKYNASGELLESYPSEGGNLLAFKKEADYQEAAFWFSNVGQNQLTKKEIVVSEVYKQCLPKCIDSDQTNITVEPTSESLLIFDTIMGNNPFGIYMKDVYDYCIDENQFVEHYCVNETGFTTKTYNCQAGTNCLTNSCYPGGACAETNCNDGIDNDFNGCIDSTDSSCPDSIHENIETSCDDEYDNDCDNLTDCEDSNCQSWKLGVKEILCSDGYDNNCNNQTDCADDDCNLKPCGGKGMICSNNVCTDIKGPGQAAFQEKIFVQIYSYKDFLEELNKCELKKEAGVCNAVCGTKTCIFADGGRNSCLEEGSTKCTCC